MKILTGLIKSPFRDDKKPTCAFYTSKSGRLYLHDFATEEHIDCIEVVKRLFKCTFKEAIDKIVYDRDKFIHTNKVEKATKNLEFIIGDSNSYSYFHKFGITNSTLIRYKVFPAKTIFVDEESIAKSNKSNPIFVYVWSSGRIKVYRPLSKDSTKKWAGNSTMEDIAGYDQLPKKGQLLFITSSLKDVMALHELGYNAIAFNGEGYGISGDSEKIMRNTLTKLDRRFEHIIFYLDNDFPGITFANKLRQVHKKFFVHNPFKSPKDISDYIYNKGFHNGKRLIKKLLSQHFNIRRNEFFL